MPKFKVIATMYTFYDAIVEAKDEQEAFELAKNDEVEWREPSANEMRGDWQVHGDMIMELPDDKA